MALTNWARRTASACVTLKGVPPSLITNSRRASSRMIFRKSLFEASFGLFFAPGGRPPGLPDWPGFHWCLTIALGLSPLLPPPARPPRQGLRGPLLIALPPRRANRFGGHDR